VKCRTHSAANAQDDLLLKMNFFWISQGSVVTFLRCNWQSDKNLSNFGIILCTKYRIIQKDLFWDTM